MDKDIRRKLHKIYLHMKERCYDHSDKRYADWGGRGIHICDIANRFGTKNQCHNFYGGHPIGKIHELEEPAVVTETGKKSPYPFDFEPTFHKYRLNEYQNKKGRNIFVCSMADLFGDWVPDEWIEEVFKACHDATQHNYLFLTKNPERYAELGMPCDNYLWYGTSVCKKDDIQKCKYLPLGGKKIKENAW